MNKYIFAFAACLAVASAQYHNIPYAAAPAPAPYHSAPHPYHSAPNPYHSAHHGVAPTVVYQAIPAPAYAPSPVYAPAPIYAPSPVYAPAPVHAPASPLVAAPSHPSATAAAASSAASLQPGTYSQLAVPSYAILSEEPLPTYDISSVYGGVPAHASAY